MAGRPNIAAGDQPTKPGSLPPLLPGQVRYGQNNLKVGYPKASQVTQPAPGGDHQYPTNSTRTPASIGADQLPPGQTPPIVPGQTVPGQGPGTQPAAPGALSYLNHAQQARVTKLLGDAYDPTKPLNTQLFQAHWASLDPQGRKAFANKLKGTFLDEGASMNSPQEVHNAYLNVLHSQNQGEQQLYDQALQNYHAANSGFAQSETEYKANLSYWKDFAGSPEGQAFIAGQGMTPQAWIAQQKTDMAAGLQQYQQEKAQFSHIQGLAARLGIDVPGMVPPGWSDTLAHIQAGTAPMPDASMIHKYPGIAADLANIAPGTYNPAAAAAAGRAERAGTGAPTDQAQNGFNNFTNFTGVQVGVPGATRGVFSQADVTNEPQTI